jgi:hypothetical protein
MLPSPFEQAAATSLIHAEKRLLGGAAPTIAAPAHHIKFTGSLWFPWVAARTLGESRSVSGPVLELNAAFQHGGTMRSCRHLSFIRQF